MSGTVSYREMREFAEGIEKIFPSAVCSGIVGDARHRGGYHIGREFQPPTNYSVVRPDDRAGQGPDDGASAVDMTMNARDMRLATARLAIAYRDKADPRRKYINAFNGWDGGPDATRYDCYACKAYRATPDHKSHLHLEQRRRYITDPIANEAIWSILRGESVAAWLKSRGIAVKLHPAAGKRPEPAVVTLKPPPYPGRVLRRNDQATRPDPAVRQWQQRMRERGWTSIGKADGLPDRDFERVVKAWQKTIGLKVDGLVGPKTWPTPWTRRIVG